jgi:hypothetical protein
MPDILSLFPTGADTPPPATLQPGADILSLFPTGDAAADPFTLFATGEKHTAFKQDTAETRRIGDLMIPKPSASTPVSARPAGVNIPGISGPPAGLDFGEVGRAASEGAAAGYNNGALVTPAGVAAADKYGIGFLPRGINYLSQPAAGIAGGIANAGKDVVYQAANALAPGLGRDAVQGVDLASPFVFAGARPPASVNLLADNATAARTAGTAAATQRASPLSQEFLAAPMAPGFSGQPNLMIPPRTIQAGDRVITLPPAGDAVPTSAPTSTNPNLPPVPVNRPAAPPSAAAIPNGLTPAQIAEFEHIPDNLPPASGPIKTPADAEARADQIIAHFASIGNKTPIPGAEGALPTITGNAGLATLYRAVRDSDTPVPFTTLENASKSKAMGQLRTMAGTPEDLAAAKEARAATVAPMYKAAFANKTEADFAAPTQTAQDILKSPAGQNDTVAAEMPKIIKKLKDQTDPEQLKGIADNIDATLDGLATEGKADRETRRSLDAVKQSIISSIGDAAPGFDAAQAEFSRQSRRIDEMKYLQGRKMTDLQGNPTLGNMRSTLDDIGKKQAGDKFHPADSVTPENMQTLQKLHDQMQREQLTQTAGKSLGSTTFQNLATNSRIASLTGHVGNALAGGVIGGGIDLLSGGGGVTGMLTGNALGGAAQYYAGRSAANAAASAEAGQKMLMQALRDRLLNINNKGVQSLANRQQP